MITPLLNSRSSGFLVVGYHGCDAVIRDDLVKGTIKCLNSSKNDYDWLGPGFYLFENDPVRAQKLAEASRAHPERMYTKEPIATPAVVGVVLRVQRWLDMTTQDGLQRFADAHRKIGELFQAAHQDLPVNGSAGSHDTDFILRRLDNAVFHRVLRETPAFRPERKGVQPKAATGKISSIKTCDNQTGLRSTESNVLAAGLAVSAHGEAVSPVCR